MDQLLDMESLPTAVFAASDVMAIGALMSIRDFGLQVPRDISLLGFDDIPEVSITTPKLSTIAQPQYQTGEVAGRSLFERIEGTPPHLREKIVLEHRLVVRESTGPPT
jgi:DNA-binding LacI/PurR family transcriptional regulator